MKPDKVISLNWDKCLLPVVIGTREQEEAALFYADGTCIRGTQCQCVQLGLSSPGTAIHESCCVLCIRKESPKTYCNLDTEYPTEILTPGWYGPLVAFSADYLRKTDHGFIQCFEQSKRKKTSTSLLLHYFNLTTDSFEKKEWYIRVCVNGKCKRRGVRTLQNSSFSTGEDFVVYHRKENRLICQECRNPVQQIFSDCGTVLYQGILYVRCILCDVLMERTALITLHVCNDCAAKLDGKYNAVVCMVCGSENTNPKKKRLITFRPEDVTIKPEWEQLLGNGTSIVLCKKHLTCITKRD